MWSSMSPHLPLQLFGNCSLNVATGASICRGLLSHRLADSTHREMLPEHVNGSLACL